MKSPNKLSNAMDSPLPGENYLSDTKNYPWHRPPKYSNIDEAVDYTIKRLLDKKRSIKLVTAMEMGVPIVNLTQMYLMTEVSRGKWTVDMALLLAGPTAHILKMMAEGYGIKYNMGTEDNEVIFTKSFYDNANKLTYKSEVAEEIKETQKSGGFLDVKSEVA